MNPMIEAFFVLSLSYYLFCISCVFCHLRRLLSIRNVGAGLPELVGKYLGGRTKKVMLVFSVLLLKMVACFLEGSSPLPSF